MPDNLHNRPGITEEYLNENGIRHGDEDEVAKCCGARATGLLIPFQLEGGDGTREAILAADGDPFLRARLDNQDAVRPPRRYTQRTGSGVHSYMPIGWGDGHSNDNMILAESEFKALAVNDPHQTFQVPAVGLTGFYGFQQGNGKEIDKPTLTPELAYAIAQLKPRRLDFVGDNDTALNLQFSYAAIRLKSLVPGLALYLPRIPLNLPKGIDDVRAEMQGKFELFFRKMVDDAVQVPVSMDPSDLALLLFRGELFPLRKMHEREPFRILRRMAKFAAGGSKLFGDEVTDILKVELGVRKADFTKMVVDMRREKSASDTESPEERIARAVKAFAYDGENYWKQDEANIS